MDLDALREALERNHWFPAPDRAQQNEEAYQTWLADVKLILAAARAVLDSEEAIQRLILNGYKVSELPPDPSTPLVLRVPPNAEGTLDVAQALQRATGRLVIVLEGGFELADSEEAMFCPVHKSRWYDGMCERAAASEAYNEAWDMWKECTEPVRVRLLAEEGTPRFDPMSDPTFDPDHVTPGGSP